MKVDTKQDKYIRFLSFQVQFNMFTLCKLTFEINVLFLLKCIKTL